MFCYKPVSLQYDMLYIAKYAVEMFCIDRLKSRREFQRWSTPLNRMRWLPLDRCKQRIRAGFRFGLQTPPFLTVTNSVGMAMERVLLASQRNPELEGARSFG
jgi:hypothetical protein